MSENKYSVIDVALLATSFNKSVQTINRWIKNNDDRLSSDKAKKALDKKSKK